MSDTLNKNHLLFGYSPHEPVLQAHADRVADEPVDWPGLRDEEWKYTHVTGLRQFKLSQPVWPAPVENITRVNNAVHFTVVNGRLINPTHTSFPFVRTWKNCSEEQKKRLRHVKPIRSNTFTQINTAWCTDALYIHIPSNQVVDEIICIDMYLLGLAQTSQFRIFIEADKNSASKFLIRHLGDTSTSGFFNSVISVEAGINAQTECLTWQHVPGNTWQFNNISIKQEENSRVRFHSFSSGGNFIRNDVGVYLNAQHTHTSLSGVMMGSGSMHVDNHTQVEHKHPNCISNEMYKYILNDAAVGVFNGKVNVHREAQKTLAYQTNANLLLGDDAIIYTKPELQIYADDVKCSHGSTTGYLDEDALFYLRSRGIGPHAATRLLLQAFAGEVIERIESEDLKQFALTRTEQILSPER